MQTQIITVIGPSSDIMVFDTSLSDEADPGQSGFRETDTCGRGFGLHQKEFSLPF